MFLFKIDKIISLDYQKYEDQFESIDHTGVSLWGLEYNPEIGTISCSVKILYGDLGKSTPLKFLSDPELKGSIETITRNNGKTIVQISFKTIFLSGFEIMISQMVKPGRKVLSISDADRITLQKVSGQKDLLELLAKLYSPSKKNEILDLAKLAFIPKTTKSQTDSYSSWDPIVKADTKRCTYFYLNLRKFKQYSGTLQNSIIALLISDKKEGLEIQGELKNGDKPIGSNKKSYITLKPFLDLPHPDHPILQNSNYSFHALKKYKTIYNSYNSLVFGLSYDIQTKIFGYAESIQEEIGILLESRKTINVNQNEVKKWHLLMQIADNEFNLDLNDIMGGGIIYLMYKAESMGFHSNMKIETVTQWS